jgi:tRNA pseudouridine55 synthase
MKHGCLVIDKPPGMTSHDVVARCRKQLGIKKIGHTGTLDPDATGVLVVCVGQATKIIPYLEEADKGYVATVVFGTSTTTLDAAGEVTKRVPIASLFPVDPALAKLTTIDALKPPQVSAIKVAGKKLYEHARKGNVIDVPARPMKVLELEVLTPLQLHDDQAIDDVVFESLQRQLHSVDGRVSRRASGASCAFGLAASNPQRHLHNRAVDSTSGRNIHHTALADRASLRVSPS